MTGLQNKVTAVLCECGHRLAEHLEDPMTHFTWCGLRSIGKCACREWNPQRKALPAVMPWGPAYWPVDEE